MVTATAIALYFVLYIHYYFMYSKNGRKITQSVNEALMVILLLAKSTNVHSKFSTAKSRNTNQPNVKWITRTSDEECVNDYYYYRWFAVKTANVLKYSQEIKMSIEFIRVLCAWMPMLMHTIQSIIFMAVLFGWCCRKLFLFFSKESIPIYILANARYDFYKTKKPCRNYFNHLNRKLNRRCGQLRSISIQWAIGCLHYI